jgi:hypothetical protein
VACAVALEIMKKRQQRKITTYTYIGMIWGPDDYL